MAALSLSAPVQAAGQGQATLPVPCPPDSDRDALLASDLNAASRDEVAGGRAAREGGGRARVRWDPALSVAARTGSCWRAVTSPAETSSPRPRCYRRYEASLEASGEDTRWVQPRVKVLELAARTGSAASGAPGSAPASAYAADPEARLALADARGGARARRQERRAGEVRLRHAPGPAVRRRRHRRGRARRAGGPERRGDSRIPPGARRRPGTRRGGGAAGQPPLGASRPGEQGGIAPAARSHGVGAPGFAEPAPAIGRALGRVGRSRGRAPAPGRVARVRLGRGAQADRRPARGARGARVLAVVRRRRRPP